MRHHIQAAVVLCALATTAASLSAATPIATYEFNGNFNAQEAGKPALVATDPGDLSGFQTDTVLGASRSVWAFSAATHTNVDQAGLTLNTTGVIPPQSYSVDMVFKFTQSDNAWRRIIDVEARHSDSGFYVNPADTLAVYPVSGSSALWTNNVYHHVVLTDSGTTVKGYIDGVSEFSFDTPLLNIDQADNPSRLMNFFLDNIDGGGQSEYSDGKVSLIRVWSGVLTDQEASTLANNPFVPEPATLGTLAAAGTVAFARRRR